MTRRSNTTTTQRTASIPPLDGTLPATDPRDILPRLLRSAFVPPFSPLRQALSDTEQHFMRSFYVPTVPDRSDTRRTQFQHRANATSALLENVHSQGVSRKDVRFALEQIRYIPFLDEVKAWIRSAKTGTPSSTPQPITFDVHDRAYAKDAFQNLAHQLRVPFHMFDKGKIEPLYIPAVGFAMRVHASGKRWTFLTALSNGSILTAPSDNPQELTRGLASQNRQLVNILEQRAPVHLEKALAPRPVTDVGSKRVSLFLKGDGSSPTNYIYLPPSLKDIHLVPQVDWEGLLRGEKRLFLMSEDAKRHVATVTIPSGRNPVPIVSWGKDISASPFKRFKPFGSFLRGTTNQPPSPLDITIHRLQKSPRYTQQRVLLGKQMSVPTWYPLRTITVHAGIGPDGSRFLGLYPPGVSPATNPPLRAFILKEERVHLKPVEVSTVWPGLKGRAEEVRDLLKTVTSSNNTASREAWLTIHHLAETEPLILSTLLLAQQSDASIHNDQFIEKIPGWQSFSSLLESRLLEGQARSVPFVAYLLAHVHRTDNPKWPDGILATVGLSDVSYAMPSDPLTHLSRLATVAPAALEASIEHLRNSHVEPVRALVASDSFSHLLLRLARPARERNQL